MDFSLAIIQMAVGLATLAAILYGLWRMIEITREAKMARIEAVAASRRGEDAAFAAAAHAKDATSVIADVAKIVQKQGADLAELTLNTNSIREQLVASTAKASDLEGERRGIEIGTAAASAAAAKKE